jgi:hypothetical protein
MSLLLNQTVIRVFSGQGLFGVSFLYVFEFMGKVLLLFVISAIISKLFKLDKAYENLNHHENA